MTVGVEISLNYYFLNEWNVPILFNTALITAKI